jgi:uncharacterized protein
MKRIIDYYLLKWKNDTYDRKSLLLRGARQIGKTYAVRQLGKTYESFVEVNLEFQIELREIFKTTLDPYKIIEHISSTLGQEIIPGKTLLFLDEIQIVPQTIIALRYFYELMPELHVIAAGSLLDFAIQQVGMPVGRVEFLYMRPLSFIEFLAATNQTNVLHHILQHDPHTPMDETLHNNYLQAINSYLAIGGIPRAVQTFINQKSLTEVATIHGTIIDAYYQDFSTYAKKHQVVFVEKIFNQIPQQLGHKFNYTLIDGDFKKRELVPALDLLITAIMAKKVYYSIGQGLPLGGQRNDLDFKLIFLDTGLAQHILGHKLAAWTPTDSQNFINKGSLVESFVGQEISAYTNPKFKHDLYYWHKDSAPQAEIDYLVDIDYHVVPVEVKSGQGSTLHSLNYFLDHHKQSSYGIRLSTQNYSIHERIHSYPLYAIAQFMSKENQDMRAAIENLTNSM